MRLAILLSLSLAIFGCSKTNETRTETAWPVDIATSQHQETLTAEPECENISGIIGSANISFDELTVIHFYSQPNKAKSPAQTLRFYNDTALRMISFRAQGEKTYLELSPDRHKLDYFQFHLSAVSRRNGWLEVIVGSQKDETLWLKENKNVRFEDWLQSMKGSFAVGRRARQDNRLRAKPDSAGIALNFNGKDCFKVLDMKGDWIKVALQNHCGEAPEQSVTGWFRWRDENNCLLVEIFPFA
jgi:hypothetical protein